MESQILIWVVGLVAGALSIWKIFDLIKWSGIFSKASSILEKVADGADALALVADGVGFSKLAEGLREAADVPDELGDVALILAEATEDDELDKDEILAAIAAGKEVLVEGKDFYLKVLKKPTE